MILWYKKRGETPLQALTRLRLEKPELIQETLSYAGRLDPMAEGALPVLVGKEENKNRKDFLQKDKEYQADFLIGCSTDTHDVLGVIVDTNFKIFESEKINSVFESLTSITEQTYPWYSSKPVNGISLFEHARKGNFDIERPKRDVKIYSVSDISVCEVDVKNLIEQNIKDVQNVIGDFRQEEIVESWRKVLELAGQAKPAPLAQLVSCTLRVSSGTYIRSLTENIEQALGVPVLLQKLIRTEVF
jgi:tRNA pseudouridine(55) synthase